MRKNIDSNIVNVILIFVIVILVFVLVLVKTRCNDRIKSYKAKYRQCSQDLAECKDQCNELQSILDNMYQDKKDVLYQIALKKAKPYIPERFVREIVDDALRYQQGVLLLSLITVESHFDPFAVSPTGAVGCAQVKPDVWIDYLKEKGVVQSVRDFRDPAKCVDIAYAILEYFLNKNQNLIDALAMYQCGESNKKCIKTTGRKYASEIMKEYGEYMYLQRNRDSS